MNVALAGSGGGSTRRSDAHEEVSALQTQLDALGATLTHVQLISCEVPLDRASLASRSELWTLASSAALAQRAKGTLGEVKSAYTKETEEKLEWQAQCKAREAQVAALLSRARHGNVGGHMLLCTPRSTGFGRSFSRPAVSNPRPRCRTSIAANMAGC